MCVYCVGVKTVTRDTVFNVAAFEYAGHIPMFGKCDYVRKTRSDASFRGGVYVFKNRPLLMGTIPYSGDHSLLTGTIPYLCYIITP